MEYSKKNLRTINTFILLILLSGCGNISNESGAKLDDQSRNTYSSEHTNDDDNQNSTESDSNTDNSNENKIDEKSIEAAYGDEDSATNETEANLKERYQKKLNDTKKETSELKATDSSTYALKKVENDRWDMWDDLLNDIYGVLKEQLPTEKMEQLRDEQRNWIKNRDERALQASLKYKGGTQENLEYVAVLANLTEQRCYELVDIYMK